MFSLVPPQIKIYIYLAVIAGLLGTGFYGGYRFELSSKEALIAKYEAAQIEAINQALAKQTKEEAEAIKASQEEAQKQKQIADKTKQQLQSVKQYVQNYKCITYGLIKTFNYAANPNYIPPSLPKGKTDFDCAPIDTVELSKNIISNYGIANANAEQLNSLIHWLQGIQQQNGKK